MSEQQTRRIEQPEESNRESRRHTGEQPFGYYNRDGVVLLDREAARAIQRLYAEWAGVKDRLDPGATGWTGSDREVQ